LLTDQVRTLWWVGAHSWVNCIISSVLGLSIALQSMYKTKY
jgi:hypothetical protein